MTMDDLLKELQLEYIQSIPEKINELESFHSNKDLNGLLNCFHKLKGSGKTYGIEEITILGQFFEDWMRDKGQKMMAFVPHAIVIMHKISKARNQKQAFDISNDLDFKKLENLK